MKINKVNTPSYLKLYKVSIDMTASEKFNNFGVLTIIMHYDNMDDVKVCLIDYLTFKLGCQRDEICYENDEVDCLFIKILGELFIVNYIEIPITIGIIFSSL